MPIARPPSQDGTAVAFTIGVFFSSRIIIPLVCVALLGEEARFGAEIAVALGMVLLGVVSFHSLGHSSPRLISTLKLPSIQWVVFYLVFSGFSLTWSIAVSPVTSAAYWCAMVADVAIVIVLLGGQMVIKRSLALMRGFIWSTCFLAIIAWLMPVQPDLRLGDPVYFNTNQIANVCAVAIFMAEYLMSRRDGRWHPVIWFLGITLLRSLSKTTIIGFLLSQTVVLLWSGAMSRRTKLMVVCATIVVFAIFWGLFSSYFEIYTNAGNQAETLTGRTAIWAFALEGALQRPWIGSGFDALWKVMPPFGPDQFQARHAENEILQQFYAYGVVGIVMLASLYGSLYMRVRRMEPYSSKIVLTSFLLYIIVRGLAEAEPFDLLLPLWAIVLLTLMLAAEADRKESGIQERHLQPETGTEIAI